jgi:hypothetical protein
MSRIHISTGTGHAIDTAPLLTHHVYHEMIEEGQYGVLGHVLAVQYVLAYIQCDFDLTQYSKG